MERDEQHEEAQRAVHEAAHGLIREGEVLVSWMMVLEVAAPNGDRYLAHRTGGGHDGTDSAPTWTVLGMADSARDLARLQLREGTVDATDDDEEP